MHKEAILLPKGDSRPLRPPPPSYLEQQLVKAATHLGEVQQILRTIKGDAQNSSNFKALSELEQQLVRAVTHLRNMRKVVARHYGEVRVLLAAID